MPPKRPSTSIPLLCARQSPSPATPLFRHNEHADRRLVVLPAGFEHHVERPMRQEPVVETTQAEEELLRWMNKMRRLNEDQKWRLLNVTMWMCFSPEKDQKVGVSGSACWLNQAKPMYGICACNRPLKQPPMEVNGPYTEWLSIVT